MNTDFAIQKAGNRGKLATLLGVDPITTYQPGWKPNLPGKHERYLRAIRPKWFKEWAEQQAKQGASQ
jgi:hypothetical protein